MNYKQYRIYLNTPTAGYIIAASNTVNDLVNLSKYWLTNTNAGLQLPSNVSGILTLQQLDPATGAYVTSERAEYKSKKDIITQLRKLGGR